MSWGLWLHPKLMMERSGQGEKDVGKTRSELGFGESVGRPTWGGRMVLPMSINASFRPCHTERQDRLEPGCEELCGAENLQFSPVDSTRDVASRI